MILRIVRSEAPVRRVMSAKPRPARRRTWILSRAERAAGGADLPRMETSINTFTRLWLGTARPADLAYLAPDLDAPPELVERLDRVLRLPKPCPDWDI